MKQFQTWEIYDIRTGKALVETPQTYKFTNLTRIEADEVISKIQLNVIKGCNDEDEARFLLTNGIPYDKRKYGSKYCKSVEESVIRLWYLYGY